MENALVSLGYDVQDYTEHYMQQDATLQRSIIAEKDDIKFYFFVFDNNKSAINLMQRAYADIIKRHDSAEKTETSEDRKNYYYYSLRALGLYSVTEYVESTAVYAHCSEENAGEISKILLEIGYIEPPSKAYTRFDNMLRSIDESGRTPAVTTIMLCIITLIMYKMALNWLWGLTCAAAGLETYKVKIKRRELRQGHKPPWKIYAWMLENAGDKQKFSLLYFAYKTCFLPNLIILLLAIVGLFTNVFNPLLENSFIVLIGAAVIYGIAGAVYSRWRK